MLSVLKTVRPPRYPQFPSLLRSLAHTPVLDDYKSMALIRLGDDTDIAQSANTDLEAIPGNALGLTPAENAAEQSALHRASVIAKSLTGILTIALLVLWPMPMYGTGYVFSKKFFTGWVSVGILWLFCSAMCVGIYPLWEGRKSMKHTFGGIVRDLKGKGRGKGTVEGRGVVEEEGGSEGSGRGSGEKEKGVESGVLEKR